MRPGPVSPGFPSLPTGRGRRRLRMPQLIEFASNHLALVAAFFGVLGVLLFTLRQAAHDLSPNRAVQMLNHEHAVPVDLRSEQDFNAGHIINALRVSPEAIAEGASALQKYREKPLLLYCETGASCPKPIQTLRKAGFTRVYRLQGGLAAWRNENLPLQ